MNAFDPNISAKIPLRLEPLTGTTAVLAKLVNEKWEPAAIIFPIRAGRYESHFAWLILHSSQTGQDERFDGAIKGAVAVLGGELI